MIMVMITNNVDKILNENNGDYNVYEISNIQECFELTYFSWRLKHAMH